MDIARPVGRNVVKVEDISVLSGRLALAEVKCVRVLDAACFEVKCFGGAVVADQVVGILRLNRYGATSVEVEFDGLVWLHLFNFLISRIALKLKLDRLISLDWIRSLEVK